MNDEDEDRRPLWQELLLLSLPILLTEGVEMLREHIRRRAKKKRKLEKDEVPVPRA